MKTVLITGSEGLVGSACMDFFVNKGWQTVGVDNNQRSKMFGVKESKVHEFDIRDTKKVEQLFKKHKFDAIIHAAGQPSHDYATNHVMEDFTINAFGTLNLLEATRKYCPKAVFVYVSSDKVYGENMETREFVPFDESLGLDFAGKRSFFGCSKAAADMYVQEYGNKLGMYTVCFRPGCITGKNHKGAEQHGFLSYLAKCIKTGKQYKIFGDGETVRDQIHALDLAAAFWSFILTPKKGAVYNIGGGPKRAASILESIALIEQATQLKCEYKFYPERDGDRQWDVHDVSKFRRDYPWWEYSYDLRGIIKDVCSTT